MHFARVLLRTAVVGLALSLPAVAQQATSPSTSCEPSWLPTFGGAPGTNGDVRALAVFDDGSGPALFVAGKFDNAGGLPANNIAKWNGTTWSTLGSGTDRDVYALAVFDDGSGPALYAGGRFRIAGGVGTNQIARWNGSTWSAVGNGLSPSVLALAVFDDGTGPALYAAGTFNAGSPYDIAKWDGSSWSTLGSRFDSAVQTLVVFDDGRGPALYAGGAFGKVDGLVVNSVAKWNGTTWSALGTGVAGGSSTSVWAFGIFDDGGGPALFVGGDFSTAGGTATRAVAKWNGSAWSGLHGGLGSTGTVLVTALGAFDDGGGAALYVGGLFDEAGAVPAHDIARWNGSTWSALDHGLDSGTTAFAVYDDGTTSRLYAGGYFTSAGGLGTSHIAAWGTTSSSGNALSWSPLGHGVDDRVTALAVYDDGAGPALYAQGLFYGAGGIAAGHIAKWDGTRWSALGDGLNGGRALAVFDDGNGAELYAADFSPNLGFGATSHVAKWNGTRWATVGTLTGGNVGVAVMTVFDDGSGPALYVGGDFTSVDAMPITRIAKWDGFAWTQLASLTTRAQCVYALAVFDDGTGSALYAGGDLSGSGGRNVVKWKGNQWIGAAPLGNIVFALTVFDDGTGRSLYAGGSFDTGTGSPRHVARWDAGEGKWTTLGSGLDNSVYALAVFADGGASTLIAGGAFAQNVAQWDGSSWSPLGNGVSGGSSAFVLALAEYDDGTGPAMHVGGQFPLSPAGDSYLAKWGCSLPRGARTFGASSPGCNGPLPMSVTASPRIGATFAITCANAPPNAAGALVLGSALAAPLAFLGTQLWVDPALAVSVASTATGSSETPLAVRADPSLVGLRFDLQLLWLGPTTPPPCPPLGLSASNALALTIQP